MTPASGLGRNVLARPADAPRTGAGVLLATPAVLLEPEADGDGWAEAFAIEGKFCALMATAYSCVVEGVDTTGSAAS